jgi:hypothetical protein
VFPDHRPLEVMVSVLNRGRLTGQPSGIGCIGLTATNAETDAPSKTEIGPRLQFRGGVILEVST